MMQVTTAKPVQEKYAIFHCTLNPSCYLLQNHLEEKQTEINRLRQEKSRLRQEKDEQIRSLEEKFKRTLEECKT